MNIFTKIRNLMECRPRRTPVEFDIGMYSEVAGQSRIYTDVLSCRQYSIPLICAGLNGVYVFITTHIHDRNKLLDIYADASRIFAFTSGVFVFIRTDNDDYFVFGADLIRIEQMLDKFENLYNNTRMPASDEAFLSLDDELDMLSTPCPSEDPSIYRSEYVISRVSTRYLHDLDRRIDGIKDAQNSRQKVKYRNGIKNVLHPILKFGVIVGEDYFPVSDEDPFKFLLLTVFGGIIGLHRFKAGEIAKGIGYILSCGCFGAGYLLDIFSILTGTYHIESSIYHDDENGYRQEKLKIFVDELSCRQKLIGYVLFAVGIGLVFIAEKTVYLPILNRIGFTLLNSVQ